MGVVHSLKYIYGLLLTPMSRQIFSTRVEWSENDLHKRNGLRNDRTIDISLT